MRTILLVIAAFWLAPMAGAQDISTGPPAAAALAQYGQPGTPLKPELSGAPAKAEPAGTTLKPNPPGPRLTSGTPGTPEKTEAAGTPETPDASGTPIKREPPGTPARPVPAGTMDRPEKEPTLSELRKKSSAAVAELKKKQADEIKTLRESLKGKPGEGIREAVKIKKAGQKSLLDALQEANSLEIAQFRKSHAKPVKQGEDTTAK